MAFRLTRNVRLFFMYSFHAYKHKTVTFSLTLVADRLTSLRIGNISDIIFSHSLQLSPNRRKTEKKPQQTRRVNARISQILMRNVMYLYLIWLADLLRL